MSENKNTSKNKTKVKYNKKLKSFETEEDFKTYHDTGMYNFLFNNNDHNLSSSKIDNLNKGNAISHFISLQPDDKLNENFFLDLKKIDLQSHYKTFEISSPDNSISRQIVQTDPETKNRFIYQISLINEQNLGKGTALSEEARLQIKTKGEYGDDGGNYVGKQLGGLGEEHNIFPQNLFVNRHSMLQLENTIKKKVKNKKKKNKKKKDKKKEDKKKEDKKIVVLYSHLAIYGEKEERPEEIHFKVTTSEGKLLHYGIIDNPPQVPTLLDFIARNFKKCWEDLDTGRPYIIDLNVELFVTILASKRLKHKNEFVLEVIQEYLSCDKYKDIRSSKQLIEIIEKCSECFTTDIFQSKLYANLSKEEQEKLMNVVTKIENQDVDDITNKLKKTLL